MSNENKWPGPPLTRRAILAHAARGAVLVSATACLVHAEALLAADASSPDASSPKRLDSFDFGWKFFKGDVPGAMQISFADANWRNVDLPHDWSIEGPYDEKAPSSGPGGYLPTGVGWYRKTFHLSEGHRDKLVTLEFGGVYQNSEVWINGNYLGLRPYGYIPFYYDLTPHLRIDGENLVAVRVDNSRQTNCRWYSGSGIYRHTWLHATHPLHVAQWGTFVTYPRITKDVATVEVKTTIAKCLKSAAHCSLNTAILDKDGNIVQVAETSQSVAAAGHYEFVQQILVQNPRLWSPSDPYLYTVRSTLHTSGSVVDVYDTPVGLREAVFDAERGFLINGEHIKLNGACIHHEAGCVGAAVPERVWERRLEILRDMGCNAIRTSHNPFAAEFLDLCDSMGFLVMAEAFDEWRVPKSQIQCGYSLYFDEWHERDLHNFIHRDRNHPSIVLWSAGNEIGDQSAPEGAETLRELLTIFHREDPTRPVTAACDRIASEPPSNTVRPEFLAQLDIVGYNYVDRWRDRAALYYSIDHEAFPLRRVIGTESIAMGSIRGDYRSLFPSDMPARSPWFLLPQNAAIDVEQLYKFVRVHDYVSGDFMWTGIDYLGEASWPMKGASAGVIDTCGFKKDGFYFYQSQWTQRPMIHLAPHWNWKGREGQMIPVICYTNCDTVEIFLNGKSLGVKGYEFPRMGMEGRYGNFPARAKVLRTTADLHLSWDVPYEAGTLKAVGTKDGAIAAAAEVITTGAPTAISLAVDRGQLAANRRDVAHVVVEVHDRNGRIVPDAANEIAFAVEGAGRIIGLDNGDPSSHEDYKASHRKAFHGLCLAILQSTGKAGRSTITASSPGLQPGSAVLTAKA